MHPTKIAVISDIHMGDGSWPGWFSEDDASRLALMFENLSRDDSIGELVLLGDIFDLWLYPTSQVPPTVSDILERWEAGPIKALRNCVARLPSVCYIPGNHDMHITRTDLLPLQHNGNAVELMTPEEYNRAWKGIVHLEHGHAVDIFNAPDSSADGLHGLPFGYFMSRLVATARSPHVSREILRSTIAFFHGRILTSPENTPFGDRFIRDIADTLMLHSDLKGTPLTDDSVIRFADASLDVSIGELKTRYHGLLDRWSEDGLLHLWNAMMASLRPDGLDWYAKELLDGTPARVVVLGHTHHGEDYVWVEGSYGNAGCWCKETVDREPTWVEIGMEEEKASVTLNQWNTGQLRKEELTRQVVSLI